jgi:hypothetical protein
MDSTSESSYLRTTSTRDELDIYWTRKKQTCAHPLHGDSKAKPDRCINAVMSREIWLRYGLDLAICPRSDEFQKL